MYAPIHWRLRLSSRIHFQNGFIAWIKWLPYWGSRLANSAFLFTILFLTWLCFTTELNASYILSSQSIDKSDTGLELKQRLPTRTTSKVHLNIDSPESLHCNGLFQSCSTTSEDSGVQESLAAISLQDLSKFKDDNKEDEQGKENNNHDAIEQFCSILAYWYRVYYVWFMVAFFLGYNVFFGFAVHRSWHRVSPWISKKYYFVNCIHYSFLDYKLLFWSETAHHFDHTSLHHCFVPVYTQALPVEWSGQEMANWQLMAESFFTTTSGFQNCRLGRCLGVHCWVHCLQRLARKRTSLFRSWLFGLYPPWLCFFS